MSQPVVFQLLFGTCFGLLLARLIWSALRGGIPRNRAIIWAVVWGSGLVLVLSPSLSFHLARILGVHRGTDAVTYLAIALLSVMVFRTFQLLDAQDQALSRLTTELALYEWQAQSAIRPEPGTPRVAVPPDPGAEAPV
jgi:hypothetical protein